jgi:xanthine dehydrogenase YagS FAD-binding subunit
MMPFNYQRSDDAAAAVKGSHWALDRRDAPQVDYPAQYLAGGTTLIDLMKLNVMRPATVIDINALEKSELGKIEMTPQGLKLGALARMAQVADDPGVKENFPVLAQSLQLAASQQLRNMASLGGNVLQRTRCTYFRDMSYPNCNKRSPGSGCAALEGVNRMHAVLGVSDNCIATYPGDFAQALIALDAEIEINGASGLRRIPFAQLHRAPGDTPHLDSNLAPGELITAFFVPTGAWTKRSLYLKIRDRESYEFALASAAVALDMQGKTIKEARIALGGVSALPWRAREAEAVLKGTDAASAAFAEAAEAAFKGAIPHEHNRFKIELGKRTLQRALAQASTLSI